MTMLPDPIAARLAALGLALPASCPPRARFLPWRRVGGLLVLSGQVNERDGVVLAPGPVEDLAPGQAEIQARACLLNLLFNLRAACDGRLDRVRQWVRLGGFVAGRSGFAEAPRVIDGASELLIALYGEAGMHARTAVAVAGLPGGACVEIDAMVELSGP